MTIEARVERIRQWHAGAAAGDQVIYGVFLDCRPIGGCGLHRAPGSSTFEIGYWIDARRTARGYATEVASALTGTAFEQLDVDTVEIHHDRANVASGRIPARIGFALFVEQRRPPEAPGECGTGCGWRIDRATWQRLTQADAV